MKLINTFVLNNKYKNTMRTSFLRKTMIAVMITVSAVSATAQEKVMKILAVGNSFSRDAVEQYLWDLADADGEKCIIGNLYIGGCPISRHADNARNDAPAYEYRKIGADGIRVQTDNKRLDEALCEEQWDVVTVQQASYDSGNYDSFSLLPELVAYIRARSFLYKGVVPPDLGIRADKQPQRLQAIRQRPDDDVPCNIRMFRQSCTRQQSSRNNSGRHGNTDSTLNRAGRQPQRRRLSP